MNNKQNINGEYLKFYFTTNPSMPQILKNTGAVTILNKSAENYSYNEFWVADEFIATGYGFASQNIKETLDKYGDFYVDNLGYIYPFSYLDYKFDEAHESYISSLEYTDKLRNDILTYFVGNSGDSSNTYINYYDTYLPIKFLPYLHETAKYKDINIKNTHITCYGFEYGSPNIPTENDIILDSDYNSNIYFNLPVGSKITRAKIEAEIDLNNVSPQNYSTSTYFIELSEYNQNTNGDDFIDNKYSYFNACTDNYISDSNTHKICIDLNNNLCVSIKEGLQTLTSTYINYQGTLSYSYYPALSEKAGINIYSYENVIKPNKYDLGNIYINGCFEITYITNYSQSNLSELDLHPFSSRNNNLKHKMIINNKVSINVDSGFTYFGVPKHLSIIDAKWAHKSNLSQNHHESYINQCGDIFKDASNSYTKLRCHYAYYSNDEQIKYINYDHYVTYIPESTVLYLEFRNDNFDNESNSQIETIFAKNPDEDVLKAYTFASTNNFVQNEIYNGTHWFRPIDLSYMYIR